MKHWKVLLAAALIFASGVITGSFAFRSAPTPPPRTLPRPPTDARFDALRQMQEELNLSPLQAERIDAILKDGHQRMRQFWESCQPQVRDEMHRVRQLIEAELDESQRLQYDALLKRSKPHRGPPHAGGDAPPYRRRPDRPPDP
ncbi:MAG: hypothetical protein KF833_13630 [Verrucomicrobiae bacterium]|nr:hypothetical protein [Verrucomicrobiae bacterium]